MLEVSLTSRVDKRKCVIAECKIPHSSPKPTTFMAVTRQAAQIGPIEYDRFGPEPVRVKMPQTMQGLDSRFKLDVMTNIYSRIMNELFSQKGWDHNTA